MDNTGPGLAASPNLPIRKPPHGPASSPVSTPPPMLQVACMKALVGVRCLLASLAAVHTHAEAPATFDSIAFTGVAVHHNPLAPYVSLTQQGNMLASETKMLSFEKKQWKNRGCMCPIQPAQRGLCIRVASTSMPPHPPCDFPCSPMHARCNASKTLQALHSNNGRDGCPTFFELFSVRAVWNAMAHTRRTRLWPLELSNAREQDPSMTKACDARSSHTTVAPNHLQSTGVALPPHRQRAKDLALCVMRPLSGYKETNSTAPTKAAIAE